MPRNPWLAIDATTSPTLLARALRRAWEHFVRGGQPDTVRPPVADSWRRSLRAGVEPLGSQLPPVFVETSEASARWEAHPLAQEARVVRECLAGTGDDSQHLVAVSDADGVLLWIEGDADIRRLAASANFTVGALWDETSAGTNAIGTALATDHAVQIFAGEHFKELAHEWTCSAAPVHNPATGEPLGTIVLSARWTAVHPHTLAVAAAAAHAVEAELSVWRLRRRRRLVSDCRGRDSAGRGRPAVRSGGGPGRQALAKLALLGRDRASVDVNGRVTELAGRPSEMLALLSTRPAGLTSESFAAELYGDAGLPDTIRVQVYRLRKLLGPCIESEPYRLTLDIECDLTRVQSSLRRGAIREAAQCYQGPLLPRSEAPGIVRDRESLDRWLRQAVMTAEDDVALWAWLRTASGWDDLAAWKRLLGHMDYRDPRRSLAASRVMALRSAYALNTSGRESYRPPGRQVA